MKFGDVFGFLARVAVRMVETCCIFVNDPNPPELPQSTNLASGTVS